MLEELRNTMGSAFAIGTTKAVPTMKEITSGEGKISDTVHLKVVKARSGSDTVHLKDHDVVRIVTVTWKILTLTPTKMLRPILSSVRKWMAMLHWTTSETRKSSQDSFLSQGWTLNSFSQSLVSLTHIST